MLLPSELAPLPVTPCNSCEADFGPCDDFVRAGDVRRLLLGEFSRACVDGLPAGDFESFSDPSEGFAPLSSRVVGVGGLHPAFESMPLLHPSTAGRDRFLVRPSSSGDSGGRWCLLATGLAAAALWVSGVAIDFLSGSARSRSRFDPELLSSGSVSVPLNADKVSAVSAATDSGLESR